MVSWGGFSAIVADDHELFRAALAEVLRREFGFRSVIEAGSLDEAIDNLGRIPNVALASIDLTMPGMDGAASVHSIREIFPDVRVAIITASERREDILQALSAGVHGYVSKIFPTSDIVAAVRVILEGKIFVPLTLAAKAAAAASDALPPLIDKTQMRLLNELSPRQKQVLELMAKGNSNKQIASDLNLAEGTVKVHVATLFRVLGAHNRASAVAAMKDLMGIRLNPS